MKIGPYTWSVNIQKVPLEGENGILACPKNMHPGIYVVSSSTCVTSIIIYLQI